jgi:hypothetical protein
VYKASGWLSRLRTRQVDDGVALSAELTRWPGGRALYDRTPASPARPARV